MTHSACRLERWRRPACSRYRVARRCPRASWRHAQHQIAAREYEASRSERGLQAPNRAHALRTYFTPAGIRVHERVEENTELLSLTLASVGRVDELVAVPVGEVSSAGARVEIRRPGLVEWYENSPEGLEQGFTLTQRPGGEGDLWLDLDVRGASASLRGDSVLLTAASGRRLSYGHLVVVDARGRELASRFEVPVTGQVRLAIDDDGAAYPVVIDPMLGSAPDTRIAGTGAQQYLGWSVAGAGDVNGDGYDDVIVSAFAYDGGQEDEGAAFLFLGSASGIASGDLTTAATQLESDVGSALFGSSVAGAGDVNGDGYGDVIIGARGYNAGLWAQGAAFVFLGSAAGIPDGNLSAAATRIEGTESGARLGQDVDGAGDIDGDGYDDVIVASQSVVAIFHGSAAGIAHGTPASARTRLVGAGSEVAGAGDVNGDGFGDVIVGASRYDGGQDDEGAAFIFHGSASGIEEGGPATAAARLEWNEAGAWFGSSVSDAGDVNRDGYGDVLVSAPLYHGGAAHGGSVFVFHGSEEGVVGADPSTASGRCASNPAGHLGSRVAGAGDVNGDGYDDVILSMQASGGGFDDRSVLVLVGTPNGIPDCDSASAAAILRPGEIVPEFGVSIAGAGDVNGDGYADVIVGAPTEYGSGKAFIFHGSEWVGAWRRGQRLESNQPESQFGASVAGAGDVNGDGFDDVVVGAPWYDTGLGDEGAAFVFHGTASGVSHGDPSSAATRLESDLESGNFGWMLTGAGDLDSDGYDDLLAAAPGTAAILVFSGSPTGSLMAGPRRQRPASIWS